MDEEITIIDFDNIDKDDLAFTNKCLKYCEDIKMGKITVLQLVEGLKTYLVHAEPEKRAYGILILSTILQNLPHHVLDETQLHFVCNFFVDRLKDNHRVIPSVLKGILALIEYPAIPKGIYSQFLTSLFHNVACQQQEPSDRKIIYEIFHNMLKNREDELQSMALDLVYGVVSSISGETNTKNLNYLFSWLPNFIKSIKLGQLTEEMFETVSCYFPVDFKVPETDKTNVRDQLAKALLPCLCAIPEFGEFAIPLAIEKFSSDLRVAKIDSLHLLISGCDIFPPEEYNKACPEIWPLIQHELFALVTKNDDEIKELCLESLTKIFHKIATSDNNSCYLSDLLPNITDTLKRNLLSINSQLYKPSADFLLAVSKSSKKTFDFICKEISSILIASHQLNESETNLNLMILVDLVQIFGRLYETTDLKYCETLTEVPKMCLQQAFHSNIECRASGLDALKLVIKFLTSDEKKLFLKGIEKILLDINVNTLYINCINEFGTQYSIDLIDFIQNLDEMQLHFVKLAFKLVNKEEFTSLIFTILAKGLNKDICLSLEILNQILLLYEDDKKIHKCVITDFNFINLILETTITNNWFVKNDSSTSIFMNISSIYKIIFRQINIEYQQILIDINLPKIIDIFMNGNQNSIYFTNGLLTCLYPDVKYDYYFLNQLFEYCLEISDLELQNVATQLLANIINKMSDELLMKNFLTKAEETIFNTLNNSKSNETIIVNSINCTVWLTKALLMKGHLHSSNWVLKLMELLKLDNRTSDGFKTIIGSNNVSLSPRNYCKIGFLYQQRFFAECCNYFLNITLDENPHYLNAFGNLLQGTPKKILDIEFTRILPIILTAMQGCTDESALIAILAMLESIIQDSQEVMIQNIEDFMPRLLYLAEFKDLLKVRISSIKCLQAYARSIWPNRMQPFIDDVLTVLGRLIDDKKRLVRKEAASARVQWYLLMVPDT